MGSRVFPQEALRRARLRISDGKQFWFCTLAMVAVAGCAPMILAAQQATSLEHKDGLPDAPGMSAPSDTSSPSVAGTRASATIFGTVLSANGAEVQGARVVLNCSSGADKRIVESGTNGEFKFTGLPSGNCKVAVSGPGWGTFVSPNIHLSAGSFHILPQVILPVSESATVRVSADPEQLAEEQVQIAEQQRVMGVFPNFYSSYDWNAPPMGPRQKFKLTLRSVSDPVTFLGVAVVAGIEQGNNNYAGYGQGMQGYSKRYAAAYANDFLGRMLSQAVFPSIFHQDPRYFYKGNGSAGSRALYAISAAVMTRGDNKRWQPNYSYILGSFATGGLSNLYYPPADRGFTLTMANGLIDIANHAGTNLLREFVLKRFTSRSSEETSQEPQRNSTAVRAAMEARSPAVRRSGHETR